MTITLNGVPMGTCPFALFITRWGLHNAHTPNLKAVYHLAIFHCKHMNFHELKVTPLFPFIGRDLKHLLRQKNMFSETLEHALQDDDNEFEK